MKLFTLLIFFYLLATPSLSQSIQEKSPSLGKLIDKSAEGEIAFIKEIEQCEEVWKKASERNGYDSLSVEEKKIYDNCSEDVEGYWDVLGPGCSWYCGGGQDTISASSSLESYKGLSYSPKNIHDLNYRTAWVEGVPGYGIGESITYHFPPENPRITEIIIINGYVKSETAWKNNSRVKKLLLYSNGKPYAILNLMDTREEQHFEFEPLGYSNRKNGDELSSFPWWTMTFEIMEVYPGDKYDDTAITELYFDGIDVH